MAAELARPDGRNADQLRPITFERDFTTMADGSVLVKFGQTHVLCTASVDEDVPRWMKGSGKGWVTAEYNMLPGSSPERIRRRTSGRDQEIQRLIGRSLRAVCDMTLLGERSIDVDCDVLQADGGTRTASITGGCVAIAIALNRLLGTGGLTDFPLRKLVTAISAGVYQGTPVLDLNYVEDKDATVDFNVVMTEDLEFVEVQGSGEEAVFSQSDMNAMLELSKSGIGELVALQRKAILEADSVGPTDLASLGDVFKTS